jgi:hypothetical protein
MTAKSSGDLRLQATSRYCAGSPRGNMTQLIIRTGLTPCEKPGNLTGIGNLLDSLCVNPPQVPYPSETLPQLTDG